MADDYNTVGDVMRVLVICEDRETIKVKEEVNGEMIEVQELVLMGPIGYIDVERFTGVLI